MDVLILVVFVMRPIAIIVVVATSLVVVLLMMDTMSIRQRRLLSWNKQPIIAESQISLSNLKCFNYPRPKVAWCISGTVRTGIYPVVYRSIKDAIDNFGGDSEVFMHLQTGDIGNPLHAPAYGPPAPLVSGNLQDIVDYIQPQSVTIINGTQELPPFAENCNFAEDSWLNKTFPGGAQKWLGQLNSIQECYKLVEKRENDTGTKFDIVIRQRADAAWLFPPLPYCAYPSDALVHPDDAWLDHVMFVPRIWSDHIFKQLQRYYDDCSKTRVISAHDAETFLKQTMDRHQIQTKGLSLPLIVTRTPDAEATLCSSTPKRKGIISSELCANMLDFNCANPYSYLRPEVTPEALEKMRKIGNTKLLNCPLVE